MAQIDEILPVIRLCHWVPLAILASSEVFLFDLYHEFSPLALAFVFLIDFSNQYVQF